MKKKRWKKVLLIILLILLILLIFGAVSVVKATRKFIAQNESKQADIPGNASTYDPDQIDALEDSPLKGKNIVFLGSSVTDGASAMGVSFADYIGKLDGVNVTKEAVSSTTLVDEWSVLAWLCYADGDSYIKRLKELDTSMEVDCLVCQLSTNDATMKKELGVISESKELKDFDTKTITGAMEYIIQYAKTTWDCPVVFYTGCYYESEEYSKMVDRLFELQEKWDIGVIDMYTDEEFNDIDSDTYDLYMYDKIHPTKVGYLKWWTPKMQEYLYEYLNK